MPVATDTEFEVALRKHFVDDNRSDIVIWSKREQFHLESVWYASRMGWMTSELIQTDEQSSYLLCELTEAGRKHFGI